MGILLTPSIALPVLLRYQTHFQWLSPSSRLAQALHDCPAQPTLLYGFHQDYVDALLVQRSQASKKTLGLCFVIVGRTQADAVRSAAWEHGMTGHR